MAAHSSFDHCSRSPSHPTCPLPRPPTLCPQAQLDAAHAASASAASETSRHQAEARALAAQLAAAAAERDAATAELRQLSHVYQQHLQQQREEMQQAVASASAAVSAAPTPLLVSAAGGKTHRTVPCRGDGLGPRGGSTASLGTCNCVR